MFPRIYTVLALVLFVAVVSINASAEVDAVDDSVVSVSAAPEDTVDDSVVSISAAPEDTVDDSVEERNPALIIAVRVLQGAFRWAAKHCLKEAAHNCKQHWKHPKALINCARGFLHANKGRCVVG